MDSQVEDSEQSHFSESENKKLPPPESNFKRLRHKVLGTRLGRLAAGLVFAGGATVGVVSSNTPPQHEDNSNLENKPSATVTATMPSQETPLVEASPTPSKVEMEEADKKAEKEFREVIVWYFNDAAKKRIIDSLDKTKNPDRNFSYQFGIKTDKRNPESNQDSFSLKLIPGPNPDPKRMDIIEIEVYLDKDGQDVTREKVKAIIQSSDAKPFPYKNERPTTYEQIQQVVEGYLAKPYEALRWSPVNGPNGEKTIEGFKKIETKVLINSNNLVLMDARTTIADSTGLTILEITSPKQLKTTRSAR